MFVLLEHDVRPAPADHPPRAGDLHWDFMLDVGDGAALRTWRLLQNPLIAGPDGVAALPLGDHRREYLEYEGELSRGRGRVRRIDRGTARVLFDDGRVLRLELAGERLRGLYEIVAESSGGVRFRRSDAY